MYVLEMLPKFIIALLILLLYVKLSGKSQIAPMSQLDQVGSMVIGALVGGSLLSPSVSTWQSVALICFWSGLLVLIRFIKSKNAKLRDVIDGKPIQLFKNGKMMCDNFVKANLSVRDFETLINVQGIFTFRELKDVWYELNGSLTVIKRGEKNIANILIENYHINQDELEYINKSEEWLMAELKKQGHDNTDEIFCAEWFDNKLWLYCNKK